MGDQDVVVMSLPAYDNWESPEVIHPSKIGSGKAAVLHPCVLVSKLNPRIPRVWYVPQTSPGIYASLEFFQVRPNDEFFDLRFLYYVILNSTVELARSVRGTTGSHQRIGKEDILRLRVRAVGIDEQRSIAATLGVLDDKIASNRRQIRLLEELGSMLLAKELDLDVFGFPSFDGELGSHLEILETGSRPKGGVSGITSGMASLGAENVQSAGVIATTAFKFVPEEFAASLRRGHLEDEDILVYKDGGKPGNFIPHVSAFGHGFPVDEATINEHVYRVRASAPLSQGLLYWLLRSPWMDQEMRKRGTGVAIPGLNSSNFRELPFPKLGDAERAKLNSALTPMLTLMLRLGKENLRLAVLRDTLLPELLSGELSVSVKGPS
jgi:type I restriction enzyme S subunit